MKRFVKTTRGLAAGIALFGVTAQQAAAQFVAVNNYQAPPAATQGYGAPPVQQQYAAPGYGYPRVAQTAELPTPAEAIKSAAPATAPQVAPAAPAAQPAYAAPAMSYSAPVTPAPATTPSSYSQPVSHGSYPVASSGCATGNCGGATSYAAPAAVQYNNYQPSGCTTGGCDTGSCYTGATYGAAPACDVGYSAPAPRRQWFAGLYGLYMNRAGDQGKAAVSSMLDTTGFTAPNVYYPTANDYTLFTTDADTDGTFGGEVRFGSTFGCDPCACTQPFAWEVGYWALNDDSGSATMILPGVVSAANTQRIYGHRRYDGIRHDLDGAGATWTERSLSDYYDPIPADGDPYANDVRVVGVRVRQRFQAQNLELNFWRFGAPAVAPAFGSGFGGVAGACGGGSCGAGSCSPCGTGSCGVGSCGAGSCGIGGGGAACRPPRRFFINGLVGIRYLRVDDDFGLDIQGVPVDVPPAPTAGSPPAGWPTGYESFPLDDPSVVFQDYEADNELVGFQLGSSMNWLLGCRWNVFADTNFGIYGNNAQVSKRIYSGGGATTTFLNGGGVVNVRGSENNLAFVGELRAGVGYQVSCNCRLTAAYRFIGVGGVALGVEEFQNTDWSNPTTASHIDTNNSIILHGLQTGVEYKF